MMNLGGMRLCALKQENSNREGSPAYVADRLSAVKWHNWKMHVIWQVNMYDPPVTLPEPKVINPLADQKEVGDVGAKNSWVAVHQSGIRSMHCFKLTRSARMKCATASAPPRSELLHR
jgi:hypothetical protein